MAGTPSMKHALGHPERFDEDGCFAARMLHAGNSAGRAEETRVFWSNNNGPEDPCDVCVCVCVCVSVSVSVSVCVC